MISIGYILCSVGVVLLDESNLIRTNVSPAIPNALESKLAIRINQFAPVQTLKIRTSTSHNKKILNISRTRSAVRGRVAELGQKYSFGRLGLARYSRYSSRGRIFTSKSKPPQLFIDRIKVLLFYGCTDCTKPKPQTQTKLKLTKKGAVALCVAGFSGAMGHPKPSKSCKKLWKMRLETWQISIYASKDK